ncbi:MAG: archaeosortase/exosortase family protein [Myxococcota bacterium]|nr:archaeosortase/exosortase family protein [Myxococcota bacterium]
MDENNDNRPREGQSPAESDPGPAQGRKNSPWKFVREVWENPAYRFVALFLPYLGVASVGYPQVVKHFNGLIQAFILATATIEYHFFALFTDQVRLDGKMVWFGNFVVRIIDECTGIYEMLIFSAAVLAFPTSWAKRGIGLLLGCPLIYLFNVVRIGGLILVGRYWSEAFDFMHLYFWQATMIAMITSVWLLWITKVVQREAQALPDTD